MQGYYSAFLLAFLSVTPLFAGQVEIVNATVTKSGADRYDFAVTLLHQDTGWEHYADKWEVRDADGHVYGTRVLLHPHVDEQPFTRQLSDIHIPVKVRVVTIRAHDSVHGYGVKTITLTLP